MSLPSSARTSETRSPEADEPSNRRFTQKIIRLARQGSWEDVQSVFQQIPQKNLIVYSALLNAAVLCGRFKDGSNILQDLRAREFQWTEPVYVSAMRIQEGLRCYAEGLALFRDMQHRGLAINPPPYVVAMNLCSQRGQYEEALRIWDEMISAGLKPQAPAFTALINAAAATGDTTKVEVHLRELRTCGLQLNGAQFGGLLKACRQSLDVEGAVSYLLEDREWSCQRTVVHFTIVMSIIRGAGIALRDFARARGLVADLVSLMSERRVEIDKYFLEEHVAAMLGADLKTVLNGSIDPLPQAQSAALLVLKSSDIDFRLRTWLTRRVEHFLVEHRK
mmetsp:Transcript_61745/g.201508  ORF Transcript_61745/g.201508 Transcript_61745/m.201508 type:complete len:335 (+) Transcript_61745:236-1240(+)